jgi:putative membrane protein
MRPAEPVPTEPSAVEPSAAMPWRRLDARMLVVMPVKQLGALAPVIVVLLVGGRGEGLWQLFSALLPVLALFAIGAVRWATVGYRVGAQRVELRSGLLRRTERSVRRDRVRTVDLRASPVHRWFGLTSVEIGTGTGTGAAKTGRLSLDGVTVPEGERLRRELLDRSGPVAVATRPAGSTAAPEAAGDSVPTEAPPAELPVDHEVARLHLSWLRYAPLTGSGLVGMGAVVGSVFKAANDTGVDLADSDTLHSAAARLSSAPLWVAVTLLVVVVLLVAAVGSLAVYVEGWWRYRLSRAADGTLRLHRGLLTTRSLSIEQRRMRGVEVIEPLLLRLAKGGRCAAVTTGLDAKTSSKGALLPSAPIGEAHRVAAVALGLADPDLATASALVRHPPAALRRRTTRALLPAVTVVVLAWWLSDAVSWLSPIWPSALLVLPLAALLAADRYRNLGHALRPEYLVISAGSLVRRRVALQRRGIIGWRLRQSPPQRWAGVVTLDAITAAGAGCYSVVDISPARAVELVERINPGLLPISAGSTRLG